jgi:hypothetical protein
MRHTAWVCTAQSSPTKTFGGSWTDSLELRYDCPCRKARREAHKQALQLARPGATSWGPSWPSGTLRAAGLTGALRRPARQAVTAGARKSVRHDRLQRAGVSSAKRSAMNTGCPPRRSVGSSQAPTDRRRGQPCIALERTSRSLRPASTTAGQALTDGAAQRGDAAEAHQHGADELVRRSAARQSPPSGTCAWSSANSGRASDHADQRRRCRSSGAATCRSTASAVPACRPWAPRSSVTRSFVCWSRSTPLQRLRVLAEAQMAADVPAADDQQRRSPRRRATCNPLPRKRLSLKAKASSASTQHRGQQPAAPSGIQAAGVGQRCPGVVGPTPFALVDCHRVEPASARHWPNRPLSVM